MPGLVLDIGSREGLYYLVSKGCKASQSIGPSMTLILNKSSSLHEDPMALVNWYHQHGYFESGIKMSEVSQLGRVWFKTSLGLDLVGSGIKELSFVHRNIE
eukprot:TRINITY_DN16711_c0_g1_i2.p2 TRINITY_DN16711_c0_g1~~TRINITY_DN16711_c0_g1_i2.p2  ORF type:complete len:101 (+),score=6.13 TRINITY_DN16711_c0_g1_i2:245-547(+)